MRDFLLDTQTIRYWYDSTCIEHPAVARNVQRVRELVAPMEVQPKLLVSVISLGEIEYGHRVAHAPNPAIQTEYTEFVARELPDALELLKDATEIYGELRARLFNKFAPGEKRRRKMRPEQLIDPITSKGLEIQENDLWLSAQAMAHGMALVSNDRMTRIREVARGMNVQLLIQNWTSENTAQILK